MGILHLALLLGAQRIHNYHSDSCDCLGCLATPRNGQYGPAEPRAMTTPVLGKEMHFQSREVTETLLLEYIHRLVDPTVTYNSA